MSSTGMLALQKYRQKCEVLKRADKGVNLVPDYRKEGYIEIDTSNSRILQHPMVFATVLFGRRNQMENMQEIVDAFGAEVISAVGPEGGKFFFSSNPYRLFILGKEANGDYYVIADELNAYRYYIHRRGNWISETLGIDNLAKDKAVSELTDVLSTVRRIFSDDNAFNDAFTK